MAGFEDLEMKMFCWLSVGASAMVFAHWIQRQLASCLSKINQSPSKFTSFRQFRLAACGSNNSRIQSESLLPFVVSSIDHDNPKYALSIEMAPLEGKEEEEGEKGLLYFMTLFSALNKRMEWRQFKSQTTEIV